jgi:hypothetical protein
MTLLPGSPGQIANELFSLIVQIAVDKAKREGLAMVHDELAKLVCDLQFKTPSGTTLTLSATCRLITDTDLQALLGQGAALRAALTADLLSAAQTEVSDSLTPYPPLAQGGLAGIALIKRIVADPESHLSENDVWLVAEPILNTGWQKLDDDQLKAMVAAANAVGINGALNAIKSKPTDSVTIQQALTSLVSAQVDTATINQAIATIQAAQADPTKIKQALTVFLYARVDPA